MADIKPQMHASSSAPILSSIASAPSISSKSTRRISGLSATSPNPTSNPPPPLDPPFRGYIESTLDALLVFEAARRGMIPRVTRRLIERERGMVQSGAVFVFDEHESGIKRWTDGMVWSPSRILGNFLVYRETDKRPPSNTPTTTTTPDISSLPPQSQSYLQSNSYYDPSISLSASGSGSGSTSGSVSPLPSLPPASASASVSSSSMNQTTAMQRPIAHTGHGHHPKPQLSAASVSGFAQPMRPRSSSEGYGHSLSQGGHGRPGSGVGTIGGPAGFYGGGGQGHLQLGTAQGYGSGYGIANVQVVVERQKERSLVGSLTGTFKFKEGGLVKKTMSVNVNGFAQHMVSYYSVEDVVANRLRTPSSLPELLALDISPEYLQKQNFRFPPVIEVGLDGIPRYAGEPEEAINTPTSSQGPSFHTTLASPRLDPGSSQTPGLTRPSSSGSMLMSPLTPLEYITTGMHAAPGYFEIQQMQHLAQGQGVLIPSASQPQQIALHHSTQPSFAQALTHMMQTPHSAEPGPMVRQVSNGSSSSSSGRSEKRSGITIKANHRYDPYGSTPPNTAPVYSSAVMSSSLPSQYADQTMGGSHHRRLSDSNGSRPLLGLTPQQSPPSPLGLASTGPSSARSSLSYGTESMETTAGYLGGEALDRVTELPTDFGEATFPGAQPIHQSGGTFYNGWPSAQVIQEPSTFVRTKHVQGFKGSPIQTTFTPDVRYASLGKVGLPSNPMLAADTIATSNPYRTTSDHRSPNPYAYNQRIDPVGVQVQVQQDHHGDYALYQTTTNMRWGGRDQLDLMPYQREDTILEHQSELEGLQGHGQVGEGYYPALQYERH